MFEKYYSILQNDEEDKIKINKKFQQYRSEFGVV